MDQYAQRVLAEELRRGGTALSRKDRAALAAAGKDPNTSSIPVVPQDQIDSQNAAARDNIVKALRGFGSTVADPFNIPSAVVGAVAPEARDSWRQMQTEGGVVPHVAGALVGGGGAFGAATKGIKSLAGLVGAGAASSAASDVIDETIGGKDGAVNSGTAMKAAMGGASALPAPVLVAGGATALGGAAVADQAMAQAKNKQRPDERLPNGYTMSELEGVATSIGQPIEVLKNMRRVEISKMLADNIGKQGDAKIEQQREEARIKREAEKVQKDAKTPLAQLYPTETLLGQVGMAGLGLLTSGLVKKAHVGRYNKEVSSSDAAARAAAERAATARSAGDYAGETAAIGEARSFQETLAKVLREGPSSKGTALPTIAGLESAFTGPQLIDRYMRAEVGSDLYNKSDPFKNAGETAQRLGGAALLGFGLSKFPTAAAGMFQREAPLGAKGAIAAYDDAASGAAAKNVEKMQELDALSAKASERVQSIRQDASQRQQDASQRQQDAQQNAALVAARHRVEREVLATMDGQKLARTPQGEEVLRDRGQALLENLRPQSSSSASGSVDMRGNIPTGAATNQAGGYSGTVALDDSSIGALVSALRGHQAPAPQRALPPPGRGRDGQLDPYNTPVNGVSPADVARDIYSEVSKGGPPTIGRGGTLPKAEYAKRVTDELRARSGDPDAKGLAQQALHDRRVDAEKQITDLAKNEGLSWSAAAQKYFTIQALRDGSGARRNVPALSVPVVGAGAGYAAMQDEQAQRETLAKSLRNGR